MTRKARVFRLARSCLRASSFSFDIPWLWGVAVRHSKGWPEAPPASASRVIIDVNHLVSIAGPSFPHAGYGARLPYQGRAVAAARRTCYTPATQHTSRDPVGLMSEVTRILSAIQE